MDWGVGMVSNRWRFVDTLPTNRRLAAHYLFDLERLKPSEVEVGVARCARHCLWDPGFSEWRFGSARFVLHGHRNVNVLEDAARGDAEHTIGRFDEVIALASAMLAAEMVDEGETGAELFSLYQKTSTVSLPFL
jgi:hypothetical protein